MTASGNVKAEIHLNAKEDVDVGILELIDHLGRPSIVQEVYVLEPVLAIHGSVTGDQCTAVQAQDCIHRQS